MVEFAMVAPFLFLLLFGIVDFGRAFQQYIMLTNAAREGARAGAVGQTSTQVCSRVTATAGQTVKSCTVTYSNTPALAGDTVNVAVTSDFEWITPVGGFVKLINGGSGGWADGSKITLSSSGNMRIE